MKNKHHELSPNTIKQINVLKKIYDIDETKRLVTVSLHYEKASEILQQDLSEINKPVLKDDILEIIDQISKTLPIDFKIDLKIKINDYEGYDPKLIASSFKTLAQIHSFKTTRERKNSWLKAALFALIGVAILILYDVLDDSKSFGVDLTGRVLKYVVDAFACVTIWQSMTVVALVHPDIIEQNKRILMSFNSFRLLDSNGLILASITHRDLKEEWVEETTKVKIGKIFLLIAGSIYLSKTAIEVVEFLFSIQYLPKVISRNPWFICSILIELSMYTLQVLAAIGAISSFKEKGPFQKVVGIFAIISLILEVTSSLLIILGLEVTRFTNTMIFSASLSITVCTMYFLGYFFTRRKKRSAK